MEYPVGPVREQMPVGEEMKLKALVMRLIREWMDEKGFLEIFLPGITEVTGSCETIANIFTLDVRERFLNLRQTAQLLMEELLVKSQLPRMYTSGRSFRREKTISDARHLSDFELFEWEALDIGLEKLLEYNEDLMGYVIQGVLKSNPPILTRGRHRTLYFWWGQLKSGHSRITYREAVKFLGDHGFPEIQYGDDLNSEAERTLTQEFGIIQVTHYPESIKFFNMLRSRDPEHSGEVDCVDLLLPYAGEAAGGSAREHDYDILREKLLTSTMLMHLQELAAQREFSADHIFAAFEPYLDLFKNESYPRAGAGLGMARLFQFLIASDAILPF